MLSIIVLIIVFLAALALFLRQAYRFGQETCTSDDYEFFMGVACFVLWAVSTGLFIKLLYDVAHDDTSNVWALAFVFSLAYSCAYTYLASFHGDAKPLTSTRPKESSTPQDKTS